MTNQVGIFVINLERRPDRLALISKHLDNPVVVKAVDGYGLEGEQSQASSLIVPPGVAGCWESHVCAYNSFLESSLKLALILEDDADLAVLSSREGGLRYFIDAWTNTMLENELNFLQVGFITDKSVRYRAKLWLYNLLRRRLQNRLPDFVLGNLRFGSHAYLVDRKAAEILKHLNLPVAFPADVFLMRFSEAQKNFGYLRMARVKTSPLGQTFDSDSSFSDIQE